MNKSVAYLTLLLVIVVAALIVNTIATSETAVTINENVLREVLGKKKEHKKKQYSVKDFDYLLLSLNWPGSVCMSLKPCKGVTEEYTNFTIHGLWPNNNSSYGPQDCGDRFDENVIKPIETSMKKYWADFKPAYPSFWEHEYDKHGSCAVAAGVFQSQFDYFNRTVNIMANLPINQYLAAADFIPSDTKTYHLDAMLSAIEAGFGYRPFVTCQSKKYIREMRFCFDKSLRPFSCRQKNEGCSDQVIWKTVHASN